jgi:hypothetical protein
MELDRGAVHCLAIEQPAGDGREGGGRRPQQDLPQFCNGACWSLRRSVAARLLPRRSEPDVRNVRTQPGDHLSRDRGKGVATAASAGNRRPRPREFPWLGGLWRPAVQRLSNTQVPVKNLRQNSKQDVPSVNERNDVWTICPVEGLGPTVHAELSSTAQLVRANDCQMRPA